MRKRTVKRTVSRRKIGSKPQAHPVKWRLEEYVYVNKVARAIGIRKES
jgi:hypothetical protein